MTMCLLIWYSHRDTTSSPILTRGGLPFPLPPLLLEDEKWLTDVHDADDDGDGENDDALLNDEPDVVSR